MHLYFVLEVHGEFQGVGIFPLFWWCTESFKGVHFYFILQVHGEFEGCASFLFFFIGAWRVSKVRIFFFILMVHGEFQGCASFYFILEMHGEFEGCTSLLYFRGARKVSRVCIFFTLFHRCTESSKTASFWFPVRGWCTIIQKVSVHREMKDSLECVHQSFYRVCTMISSVYAIKSAHLDSNVYRMEGVHLGYSEVCTVKVKGVLCSRSQKLCNWSFGVFRLLMNIN